jgi:hypothetical protein
MFSTPRILLVLLLLFFNSYNICCYLSYYLSCYLSYYLSCYLSYYLTLLSAFLEILFSLFLLLANKKIPQTVSPDFDTLTLMTRLTLRCLLIFSALPLSSVI